MRDSNNMPLERFSILVHCLINGKHGCDKNINTITIKVDSHAPPPAQQIYIYMYSLYTVVWNFATMFVSLMNE